MTTIFHPELSFRARLILYNSNRNRQSRLVPGAWTINLEIGLSWLILLKWRPSWLYGHIWWYLRAIQGIGNLLSMPVGQWCLHRLKFPSYSLPLMVSWAWSGRLVHWQCAIDFLSHNDPHLPQVFYNDMCQTLSLTLLTNTQKSITNFERNFIDTLVFVFIYYDMRLKVSTYNISENNYCAVLILRLSRTFNSSLSLLSTAGWCCLMVLMGLGATLGFRGNKLDIWEPSLWKFDPPTLNPCNLKSSF